VEEVLWSEHTADPALRTRGADSFCARENDVSVALQLIGVDVAFKRRRYVMRLRADGFGQFGNAPTYKRAAEPGIFRKLRPWRSLQIFKGGEIANFHGEFRRHLGISERFGQRICIISKCGPRTEEKTRLWLAHHKLLDQLGLDSQALHFCRKRPDKAPICKRLGVTHFIDDRLEVLTHLTSVRHRILFGPQEEGMKTKGVVRALTWTDVTARLL